MTHVPEVTPPLPNPTNQNFSTELSILQEKKTKQKNRKQKQNNNKLTSKHINKSFILFLKSTKHLTDNFST